MEVVKKMQKIV